MDKTLAGVLSKLGQENIVINLAVAKDVTFAGLYTAVTLVLQGEEAFCCYFAVATGLVLAIVFSIDLQFFT